MPRNESTQPTNRTALIPAAAGRTTLYLVRHGRTDGNLQQLLHGSTDLPLDAMGVRQAQRVAERLAAEVRAEVLLSSPLRRALTTAEIIGRRIGIEPQIVPDLVEMNFGALEGATLETIIDDHPEIARRMVDLNDHDLAWPEGESRRQFHTRVIDTFSAILATYASQGIVVVAHGGVLGSLIAQIQGQSPNDWRAYQLANCSLSQIVFTAERTDVHLLNDCVHLDELEDADLPEVAS